MSNVSELISNNELLMRTIRECNDRGLERKRFLEEALVSLAACQEKLEKRKTRIIKLIIDNELTDDDASIELNKTKKELDEVNTQILANRIELASLSVEQVPDEVLERINYTFDCLQERYGKNIGKWDFSIRRLLVEWFFGIDEKNGVWVAGSDGEVTYSIKSNLGTLAFGWLDDDTAAGIVGQEVMREKSIATLSQFSSIFNNLVRHEAPVR